MAQILDKHICMKDFSVLFCQATNKNKSFLRSILIILVSPYFWISLVNQADARCFTSIVFVGSNPRRRKYKRRQLRLFSGKINRLGSTYGAKGSDQFLVLQQYWNFINFCSRNSAMPNYSIFYRSRTYMWCRFDHFYYYEAFPNYVFNSQNIICEVFISYYNTIQPPLENVTGNLRYYILIYLCLHALSVV